MNPEIAKWTFVATEVIKELQREFSINKGLILTEGDLECHLFRLLTNAQIFSDFNETKSNNWKSGFVHSQVTWFMPERDSGFEVDITLCNPKNIDIETFEMVKDYPNKGFFHDGIALAIELKFIRDPKLAKISTDVQNDYNKIVDRLKISKEYLIEHGRYTNVTAADLAFINLVVCKSEAIYSNVIISLKKAMQARNCPDNVFPIVFCHEALTELNI